MIEAMMHTPPTISGSAIRLSNSAGPAWTSSAIDTIVTPSVTT
jgi:hypothetical protein